MIQFVIGASLTAPPMVLVLDHIRDIKEMFTRGKLVYDCFSKRDREQREPGIMMLE